MALILSRSRFFPFFPELAFDSFITANGCIGHSLFPPLAESPYFSPLSSYFTSGGTEVQTDEGWYLLNSSPCSNTPDEFGLWWIAQVVTTGSISGTIHVQIFPLGEGANQVQLSFDFDGAGVFPATGDAIPGCTNENACNYNIEATVNDGSCLYLDACGECGGSGAIYECGCTSIPEGACDCDGNVLDECGDCGGTGYFGCTDSGACNYDAGACGDDGSCEFVSCGGCTDPVACNYDPTMLLDDGSCDYCFCGPGTEYDTESGQCLIVVEDAGYCGPGTYWVEALNKVSFPRRGTQISTVVSASRICLGCSPFLATAKAKRLQLGLVVMSWNTRGTCMPQWRLGSNVGLGRTFKTPLTKTGTPFSEHDLGIRRR